MPGDRLAQKRDLLRALSAVRHHAVEQARSRLTLPCAIVCVGAARRRGTVSVRGTTVGALAACNARHMFVLRGQANARNVWNTERRSDATYRRIRQFIMTASTSVAKGLHSEGT